MDFLQQRPFQIIVIVIFVVMALAGLFLFSVYTPGSRNAVGTVEIWGTLPEEGFLVGLETLRADRRFSNVSYIEKPEATFSVDLAEAIAAGEGPDMIVITQEDILAQSNKIDVLPYNSISEREFTDTYVPVSEIFMGDSGLYGIPFLVDPLVLYYNRTTLNNQGIAEAPKTWETVTGLGSRFTERTPDGSIARSLIGFGEYTNVTNARAIISLLLLQAGAPIVTETAGGYRAALNADSRSSSAKSAISFYTQFADPAKTLYSWNRSRSSTQQAFLAGDLALYVGFASELPMLQAGNPNLDFDMARIPTPGTVQTRTTYAHVYAFAIPKASGNKQGAFETAFAISQGSAASAFAQGLSMAPVQKSILAAPKGDRYAAVFYPEVLVSRVWLSPSPSETDTIFGTMIGNITTGRMTLDTAISSANQSLDAALND